MRSNAVRWDGFTLIELLVVIAIIGVLASLIFSAIHSASSKAKIAVAKSELAQMESAIDEYKDKFGFYPPDNPNDPTINPLYFELLGTTNGAGNYVTLDAGGKISLTDLNSKFGRQGFANTSTKAHSGDAAGAPMTFLNHLGQNQVGSIDTNQPSIKILVCSVGWPPGNNPGPVAGTTLNPWRYDSSHPSNNPGSYDLWVDLAIGSKVYRVSNWSN
ncbi:MAG TPA: prepilin-type N-terminal cleavage/methylation domain-containing protein [Verrucomicrobiae bacterium]|jgi:prepilin-type N-terminal cleavage/methylation domain-containing protein|nr:prepilin-type N-terminal cleavage/methylation domain-containing protein [Verrucomicrobiae bacterium]